VIEINIMNKLIKIFAAISLLFSLTLNMFVGTAFAATSSFSVSNPGKKNTGETFNVNINVTGSEAYNAVTANVSFTNLTYVSVSANSEWTGVSGPTRSGNSITFSGAKLGGSFSGSKRVLTVTFKAPSSAGTSSISASGTIALADGSGTKVTGSSGSTSFTIQTPPPPAPTVVGAPTVSSTTHPDSNTWYLLNTATLSWNKVDGVTAFSYILDQKGDTTPDDISEGVETTKTYPSLLEGRSYFHIKALNSVGWSGVTHFLIQTDLSKPYPFSITKIKGEDGKNTIYFLTEDEFSGIAKYTLKLNGIEIGEVKSKYILETDSNDIEVTAFDRVGNIYTSKYESRLPPISSQYPQELKIETLTPEQTLFSFIFHNFVWIIVLMVLLPLIPILIFVIRKIILNRVHKA